MSYPQAHITKPGRRLVQVNDIFGGSGLIDDFITHKAGSHLSRARLLLRLRRERFDGLIAIQRKVPAHEV